MLMWVFSFYNIPLDWVAFEIIWWRLTYAIGQVLEEPSQTRHNRAPRPWNSKSWKLFYFKNLLGGLFRGAMFVNMQKPLIIWLAPLSKLLKPSHDMGIPSGPFSKWHFLVLCLWSFWTPMHFILSTFVSICFVQLSQEVFIRDAQALNELSFL